MIVVKFMAKKYRPQQYPVWRRQLPAGDDACWDGCRFEFDPDCREYDWLAVYDDLSPLGDERFPLRVEPLACAPEHTLLMTTEPSCVKVYGSDYVDQFGTILTSQEPSALSHPRAVYTHTALRWFYGDDPAALRSYEQLASGPPARKTKTVSTLCSAKRSRRTLQPQRIRFTDALQAAIPELDRFGRGVRDIEDKADALDPYRYHVIAENHIAPNYWTEKLADALLGVALPLYCGCPNATDYLPEGCFVPIDIRDVRTAIRTVRNAIATDQYTRRLPDILAARRLILERYNLFAQLSREIQRRHDPARVPVAGTVIYSRRAMLKARPRAAVRYLGEKARARWRHRSIRRPDPDCGSQARPDASRPQ